MHRWASALSGARDNLGQSYLSGGKPRGPIVGSKKYRDCAIHGRNADQGPGVGGIEHQARSGQVGKSCREVVERDALPPGPALKPKVHQIRIWRSLRAASLPRPPTASPERVRQARGDLVLHLKGRDWLIRPFPPR